VEGLLTSSARARRAGLRRRFEAAEDLWRTARRLVFVFAARAVDSRAPDAAASAATRRAPPTMNKLVVASACAAAALVTVDHVDRLQTRIGELERAPRVERREVAVLERELAHTRGELDALRRVVQSDPTAARLDRRIAALADELDLRKCEMSANDQRLASWESRWVDRDPATIDRELSELRDSIAHGAREVVRVENASALLAAAESSRLEELGRKVEPLLARDTRRMWDELVGPVVQLSGDTTVGSGVLLESQPAKDGGYTTLLLTAWHVVRDIYGSLDRTSLPVPVKAYQVDGSTRAEQAHLIAYDVALDVAVLSLDTRERVPCGARLASREHCSELAIFDSIYAVGCPLGNDPIPTYGELASTHHVVDGSTYWMISAPTYIGNSGGGVFDARTHELIGVFSKIYTHGASRSTIVPHMGLCTPLPFVYDWLEREGHASLFDSGDDGRARTAAAKR
jgi:hypothetical protein